MKAAGLPTISEWPIITTSRPCRLRPVALMSSTEAAAVHGTSAGVVVDDVADRGRVHALDVLEWVDRRGQRAAVDVLRDRPLENDSEHALESSFIARSRVLHSSCDRVISHVWSSKGMPTFFAALAWPRT